MVCTKALVVSLFCTKFLMCFVQHECDLKVDLCCVDCKYAIRGVERFLMSIWILNLALSHIMG
jgi:hypothetical protein